MTLIHKDRADLKKADNDKEREEARQSLKKHQEHLKEVWGPGMPDNLPEMEGPGGKISTRSWKLLIKAITDPLTGGDGHGSHRGGGDDDDGPGGVSVHPFECVKTQLIELNSVADMAVVVVAVVAIAVDGTTRALLRFNNDRKSWIMIT
jgi:hypothetical protein